MEPKKDAKLEGVRMALCALDCPICFEPLMPPIYQCGVGHLICKSCCDRLKKCPICPRSAFERCFGMERLVESIELPCCFAENGCTKKIAYVDKENHEKVCQHGPCFCPEPGCGFKGPAATLGDHFTGRHKWPSKTFKYDEEFNVRLQPGPHVLRAEDGNIFLMSVVAVEPLGHTISFVHVLPAATDFAFACGVKFSCFTGHRQISALYAMRSSSLADGLPKDVFCVVPKASEGTQVMLRTIIGTELEDEDEDDLKGEDEGDEDDDDE